jgi:RNA recognition motif-containing protein
MDMSTANALPEGTICQSPYTDLAYLKDNVESMDRNITKASIGLSDAQARRIISEGTNTNNSSRYAEDQQYRWDIRNLAKRPFHETHSQQDTAVGDSNNCTLFLHGILTESSTGSPLSHSDISDYFKMFGCVRVRYPSTTNTFGRPKSFCFLDFHSHEFAEKCLETTNGTVCVQGVMLSLKWSSGKSIQPAVSTLLQGIPPPPPPQGLEGIYSGPSYPPPPNLSFPKRYKRPRLSEADAADSETLFVFLPFKPASTSDDYSRLLVTIAEASQQLMENAMNDVDCAMNGTSKVTAESEPALRVTSRYPSANNNYGFLDFASHAAASVVLATLTGSIEGGDLLVNEIKLLSSTTLELDGIQIWWAMSKSKENEPKRDDRARHNLQSHHFPLDARTDCWFCLASPTCEPHLIITVYDTCYITMPKGPCDDFHALIVPVNHIGVKGSEKNEDTEQEKLEEGSEKKDRPDYFDNLGVYAYTDPLVLKDVELSKDNIWKHTDQVLGKDLFLFERAFPTYRGYHPHINCVPIRRSSGSLIINTMFEMAKNCSENFVFEEIFLPVNEEIERRKNNGDMIRGYFYAEVVSKVDVKQSRCFLFMDVQKDVEIEPDISLINNQDSNVTPPKRKVPLQFGRQVLAKTVGDPSLAYWKHCVYSKEKEEQLTNAYRQTFLSLE